MANHDESNKVYQIYDNSKIVYKKKKLIGKGGFARVYEIQHLLTGHTYADKGSIEINMAKIHLNVDWVYFIVSFLYLNIDSF